MCLRFTNGAFFVFNRVFEDTREVNMMSRKSSSAATRTTNVWHELGNNDVEFETSMWHPQSMYRFLPPKRDPDADQTEIMLSSLAMCKEKWSKLENYANSERLQRELNAFTKYGNERLATKRKELLDVREVRCAGAQEFFRRYVSKILTWLSLRSTAAFACLSKRMRAITLLAMDEASLLHIRSLPRDTESLSDATRRRLFALCTTVPSLKASYMNSFLSSFYLHQHRALVASHGTARANTFFGVRTATHQGLHHVRLTYLRRRSIVPHQGEEIFVLATFSYLSPIDGHRRIVRVFEDWSDDRSGCGEDDNLIVSVSTPTMTGREHRLVTIEFTMVKSRPDAKPIRPEADGLTLDLVHAMGIPHDAEDVYQTDFWAVFSTVRA